eukprot:TRINITY_DN7473_c1_g1_i1.p1 TRINITY_DN7473_c1_g1~~TRINITY_DN7473_c1_g1_i1.p1  ORF type:complete len:619 (+),score=194.66 TRINITY_DN7473_c1_g1_i1:86-1942(+)
MRACRGFIRVRALAAAVPPARFGSSEAAAAAPRLPAPCGAARPVNLEVEVEGLEVDAVIAAVERELLRPTGVCIPQLLARAAGAVTAGLQNGGDYGSPDILIRGAAAFAAAKADVPCLFAEVAKHVIPAIPSLAPSQLADLAAAFSSSMFYCTRLLNALERRVSDKAFLATCPPDVLTTLFQAFATLNHPLDENCVLLGAISVMKSWDAMDGDSHLTHLTADAPALCWSAGVMLQAQGGHSQAAGFVEHVAASLLAAGAVDAMTLPQATQLMLGLISMLSGAEGVPEAAAEVLALGAGRVAAGAEAGAGTMEELYFAVSALSWALQRSDNAEHIDKLHAALRALSGALCRAVDLACYAAPARAAVAARVLSDDVPCEARGALAHKLAAVVLRERAAWLDRLKPAELAVLAQTFARESLRGDASCDAALGVVLQQSLSEELRHALHAPAAAAFLDAARCTQGAPENYAALLARHLPVEEAPAAQDPLGHLLCRALLTPLEEAVSVLDAARARDTGVVADQLPSLLRRRVPHAFSVDAQPPGWGASITPSDLRKAGPLQIRVQGRTGWFHDFTKKRPDVAASAHLAAGSLSPLPEANAGGPPVAVYIPHSSLEVPRVGAL